MLRHSYLLLLNLMHARPSLIVARLSARRRFATYSASRSAAQSTLADFPGVRIPVHKIEPHPTLAVPLNGADSFAPNPVVLVLQEWWGVNEQVKAHGERIANGTSATVLIPDLYNGKSTVDAEEASHMMSSLDWEKALENLETLTTALRAHGNERRKIGTLGFCMGGAMSLALSARLAKTSHPLNAAVTFYGVPSPKLIDVSEIPIRTPVQGHFGELDDFKGFADPETARALERKWADAIRTHGGVHAQGLHKLEANVFIYPGQGHAFMNDLKKYQDLRKELKFKGDFDRHFVDGVWGNVFEFLREHLKTL
ncbi:dienelactone hydrolase family-domain-containing protein [Cladochytrium replicatum]|nr:dienelactone hydrolase family-domain-containing protein [Cladochytrium replicatum]